MNVHPPLLGDEKLRMDISAAMVDLYCKHFPSRATMADTFVNKNTVLCVLEGIYDEAELRQIEDEGEREVLERRAEIQESLKDELTGTIERLTHRRVMAFMSMNHGDPALAAELFFLEREGTSRGDNGNVSPTPAALAH